MISYLTHLIMCLVITYHRESFIYRYYDNSIELLPIPKNKQHKNEKNIAENYEKNIFFSKKCKKYARKLPKVIS